MPLTIDDKALYAGLDEMLRRIFTGAEGGLQDGATVAQDAMQTDPAHGDQSGASHASYRAFVIGGAHTGASEAASGYAAAASHLTGFTGHAGRPLSEDSGITLGLDERGVLYTSFTDYQAALEASDKAVIGPTLQQTAGLMTQMAAEGIREALG